MFVYSFSKPLFRVLLLSVFLLVGIWPQEVEAGAETTRYLIISAPRLSKVVYAKIVGKAGVPPAETKPLIDSGLRSPQGLAVDPARMLLYVADPDNRKIFVYTLGVAGGELFTEGSGSVAVEGVEARWVAVDQAGNLFYTDERANTITKTKQGFLTDKKGKGAGGASLYNGDNVQQVSAPGGVAVDNFHVFWTNKRQGAQVGSIAKAPETSNPKEVRAIATNAEKVYGVCLADHNVYYTENGFVYGVKKMGGGFTTISDHLKEPRGCIWDGDGTVYVADKTGNAVYSFPGNMHSLAPARMTKVVDFEDSFGLAVLSGDAWRNGVARLAGVVAVVSMLLSSSGLF